jgi:hypothetical protein
MSEHQAEMATPTLILKASSCCLYRDPDLWRLQLVSRQQDGDQDGRREE